MEWINSIAEAVAGVNQNRKGSEKVSSVLWDSMFIGRHLADN